MGSGCWSAAQSWGSVDAWGLAVAERSWAQPCLSTFQLVHSPQHSRAGAGPSPPSLLPACLCWQQGRGRPARLQETLQRPAQPSARSLGQRERPGPGAAASVSPRPERRSRGLPALGEPLAPSTAVTAGGRTRLTPPGHLAWPPRALERGQGPNPPGSGLALPLVGSLLQQSLPYLFICCIYLFIMAGERGSSSARAGAPALAPPSRRGRAALGLGPAACPSRLSSSPGLQQQHLPPPPPPAVGPEEAFLRLGAGRQPLPPSSLQELGRTPPLGAGGDGTTGAGGSREGSGPRQGSSGSKAPCHGLAAPPGHGTSPPGTPPSRAGVGGLSSPPQLHYSPPSSSLSPRQRGAGAEQLPRTLAEGAGASSSRPCL